MELGFWLNYKTGNVFRIDEHEDWIRRWENAKKLGISSNIYNKYTDVFKPKEDREKMLLWVMNNAPIIRARGHESSVSFEFSSVKVKDALFTIYEWGEDYAGDYTHMHIVNFKKKKKVDILWKDYKKYFDDGRENMIMEERSKDIIIIKSFKVFLEENRKKTCNISKL